MRFELTGLCQYVTFIVTFLAAVTWERSPGYKTYNGDRVLTVNVPNSQTWHTVLGILDQDVNYQDVDIWRYPDHSNTADIHVTSADYVSVTRDFRENGIDFEVKIDDLGKLVKSEHREMKQSQRARRRRDTEAAFDIVGTYPTYSEIFAWMRRMQEVNPGIVEVIPVGLTYEGREMAAIKIGIPGENKTSIWLDAGIHSREFISVTTAIYIADQLITGYKDSQPQVMWYLDSFDFYILPVANPDGFVYCHQVDRLWRKNRRPTSHPKCIGVDLNRNWDAKWGRAVSDANPCSLTYRGPTAASEPEVQNVANFLLDNNKQFIAYISFHSYSQWFFTRYSYDFVFPPEHEYLLSIAEEAVDAMFLVHYQMYVAGTSPVLMYPFSGGSPDWAMDKANVTYSYLLELRDRGKYGFILPQDKIVPTGEEVWVGMQVVFDAALERYGKIPTIGQLFPESVVSACEHCSHGLANTVIFFAISFVMASALS